MSFAPNAGVQTPPTRVVHKNGLVAMAERQPPQALQIDDVLEQISKDDQEEWEYEYSTTETEVAKPFPFLHALPHASH